MSGPAAASEVLAKEAALGTQVEVHDHEQLEIRFNYAIGRAVREGEEPLRYEVDGYLFVPKNVGLNRSNYSREQFYGDVTALMRLDAPAIPLEVLADRGAATSPLHRFAQGLELYRSSARPPASQPLVVPVKLYAFVFADAVKEEVRVLRARLRAIARGVTAQQRDKFLRDLDAALDRMRRALSSYRQVRAAYWPFEQMCHKSFVDAMRTADEYMSLFLEEELASLVDAVGDAGRHCDGSGIVTQVRLKLGDLAREESRYRAKYGYLRLIATTPEMGEYFTYSMSQMKKAVHQALYLDMRTVNSEDVFLRNAAGAVAAALGGIWAFAAQLPATLAELSASTKVAVFAAAVGAYVLKDRIKAVTNEYLTRRLRRFDHSLHLAGTTLATLGLGMVRIQVKEVMRFVSASEVPAEVSALRVGRQARSDAAGEEIMHYRKQLTVEKEEGKSFPEGYFVRDILRLNVRHFLVRLDEPKDRVSYFDSTRGTFATSRLPKVYHVNLVLKVARRQGKIADQTRLEHLRVVLNKDGIVRVERMASVGAPSGPVDSWAPMSEG
ncbi:MAG: hypothetical protein IT384_31320 [Deltaproteobacteria bacterium]|nr:hypothetical protein [Deltaproteobacteria bacterium]